MIFFLSLTHILHIISYTLSYTHIVSLSFSVCVRVSAQGAALPLLVLIDVNGKSEEGLATADLVISGAAHPN